MSTDLHAKTAIVSWVRFKKRWGYVATEVDVPGSAIADVLASDGKNLIEFEVKTNLEDVKRDRLKFDKHMIYRNVSEIIQRDEFHIVKGDLVGEAVRSWGEHWSTRVYLTKDEAEIKASGAFHHGMPYFSNYYDKYKTAEDALKAIRKQLDRKSGIPNQMVYVVHESCAEKALEIIPKEYGVVSFEDHRYSSVRTLRKAQKLHSEECGQASLTKILLRMSSELANFHLQMVGQTLLYEALKGATKVCDLDAAIE